MAENLAFRAAPTGCRRRPRGAVAPSCLARAGLAAARDRLAGQLSGGMRQKLGVIAAMLHQPGPADPGRADHRASTRSAGPGLWRLIARAAAGGGAVVVWPPPTWTRPNARPSVLVLDGGQPLAAGTPEQIVAATPGALRVAGPPATPTGPGAGAGAAELADLGAARLRPVRRGAVPPTCRTRSPWRGPGQRSRSREPRSGRSRERPHRPGRPAGPAGRPDRGAGRVRGGDPPVRPASPPSRGQTWGRAGARSSGCSAPTARARPR